ncbi:MAG TPA: ABC transporter ATP-binding protein, partial [Verrucomicrobiae bacterium]|nr:ABC transporter ATP-binding protein [Verrucomicrobiae bacterium]
MRMAGGFGGMGSQRGMASRAERGHGARQGRTDAADESKKKPLRVMDQLPEIWALMRPRRGLLAIGLVLMAINRVSGLALPYTTKYLVDNVMIHHQTRLLMPLVGGVLLATILQGVTSYTLTQTLSKAAQRMITELRRKVQEHVGRLPVAYYDANNTGALVSRIMSDVEGVRNLIGTGLVEFLGGLLTAAIA